MPTLEKITEPWELERDLKNEHDAARKIERVAHFTEKLLVEMETPQCFPKIVRVVRDPFDQELAYKSLFRLYESLFSLAKRVVEKLGKTGDLSRLRIGSRTAAEIVEDAVTRMIFQYEQEELLSPVSSKVGKKKGDYGPAMYSELVKRAGRNLVSNINSQINELLPTVTKICQGFTGVAHKFANRDARSGNERQKYEEVWLIYQAEKAARERIAEIAAITRDKIGFFQDLLADLAKISIAYQDKLESLDYLRTESAGALDELLGGDGAETTEKLDLEKQLAALGQKSEKLRKGEEKLHEIERLLLTLKNLVEKFPAIQDQIETFVESDFQAKSVYRFLEEIHQEMKGVFGQQNLMAFEVIGALVYKLKATSVMYADANYYQAAIRMSEEVAQFVERTLFEQRETGGAQKVAEALRETGLESGVATIHNTMNRIKELNNRIHEALVDFGDRFADREGSEKAPVGFESARDELTKNLDSWVREVIQLSEDDIAAQYRKCQRNFQAFTEAHLEEKHIGEQVLRAFLELSTRGVTPPLNKEELLNFQKFKLYTRMIPDGNVQRFYADALKRFMRGDGCDELTPTNIRLHFISGIARMEEKQPIHPAGSSVSRHETAIRYIAENVTPKEVESLARFVPCMPRNELRLTYPPGKLFINIAEKHLEFIRKQSQRQFVLINPGEERKNENEITFKELSGRELIKKAYGTLLLQLQPVFDRIAEEKGREEDFIDRERNKWRRELDQVIQFFQNQIDAQKSNLIDQTQLRRYSDAEKSLMSKHISSEQFDKIEALFGRRHELERGKPLTTTVLFLVEIINGFHQLAERDELVKLEFEEQQEEKRKLHLGGKTEHIDETIRKAAALGQQKKIDDLISAWEYWINRILPSSAQELKEKLETAAFSDRELADLALNLLPDQFRRVRENLALARSHASEQQLPELMGRGRQILKIISLVQKMLEKDEAMVLPHEEACRGRLAEFAGDELFRGEVAKILSVAEIQPGTRGEGDSARELKTIEQLLSALQASVSGEVLPPDLPLVTRLNLQRLVGCMRESHIRQFASLIRNKIGNQPINPAEKRLLILSYQYLRENPDGISKDDRKPILLRDDVLSELDGIRRHRLFEYLDRVHQVFVTSAEPINRWPANREIRYWTVHQGRIRAEA